MDALSTEQLAMRDHLVGKFFPPDVAMKSVSRTVGHDRVVDELAISFTHTTTIDWLLRPARSRWAARQRRRECPQGGRSQTPPCGMKVYFTFTATDTRPSQLP